MNTHRLLLLVLVIVIGIHSTPAFAQEPEPEPSSPPSGGGGSGWPHRSPFPIPSNDPGPGLLTSEAAWAQMEKARYDVYYELTGSLWVVNNALFQATAELDRFRAAIVQNFAAVLDAVAPALLPVFTRLVLFAVPLSLICYLWIGLVHIELASLRRAVLLCVLIPTLFPAMGWVFSSMEGIREGVAYQFGALTFDTISSVLGNEQAIGYGATGNRLVDIAAAALYLDPHDVAAASDMAMPERFVSGVYTVPPTNWGSVGAETRTAYMIQATDGLRSMAFALAPASLMVADAVLHALWATVLGGAFLGLAFALAFAMFASFAGEAYRLFITIFNMVIGSWIISAFQGMLIGWLFFLTTSGTVLGVVVISVVLWMVYAVFIGAVALMGIRVFSLCAGVFMPDMPDAMQRSSLRVGAAVWGGIAGGVMGGIAGTMGVFAGTTEPAPGPIPNEEA
jgi:hypothetical protein